MYRVDGRRYRKQAVPTGTRFEMLVLGSGEGGKFLSWHIARVGHRTAVIPLLSESEIWSAKVADLAHHANRFGMVTAPPPST
jgi:hypothetical protein